VASDAKRGSRNLPHKGKRVAVPPDRDSSSRAELGGLWLLMCATCAKLVGPVGFRSRRSAVSYLRLRGDFKHGPTGVAPNAIELHPILGFACLSG
jgi:hypothetical protein